MSKAKDNIQPDKIDNITKAKNRISELESEKAELIELLSDIAHFTKIESKKAQCYPAWWHRIEDLLKKHGVGI